MGFVEKMAECEYVIEKFKTDNQMERSARMNNICTRMTEVINTNLDEIEYVKNKQS